MPNGPHNVDLTVDASNSYSFSGGSDGKGNCHNGVGQGAAPVLITLHAPDGYRINDMSASPPGITLSGPGNSQMNPTVAGLGQSANITNPCRDPADVDYTVNVKASNGTIVSCHPKIVNN